MAIEVPADEFDAPPNWDDVHRMESLTTGDAWPAEWLSFDDFLAKLAARDFWTGGLATLSDAGRREWLAKVLDGCRTTSMAPLWAEIDGKYKHDSRVGGDERLRLAN